MDHTTKERNAFLSYLKKEKEEVIKAITESANHWNRIAQGIEFSGGRTSCSLCILNEKMSFILGNSLGLCSWCPVRFFTGEDFCYDTPYCKFITHIHKCHNTDATAYNRCQVYCPECEQLAKEEESFLLNLIPWVEKLCEGADFENEMKGENHG